MVYRLIADLVVIAHAAFILFVALGGLAVLKRPQLAWLHLPALAWGASSEFFGLVCPLTPLENTLRNLGGQKGYGSDFIGHYLSALIYPDGLTRDMQVALGLGALLLNLAIYGYGLRRMRRSRSGSRTVR